MTREGKYRGFKKFSGNWWLVAEIQCLSLMRLRVALTGQGREWTKDKYGQGSRIFSLPFFHLWKNSSNIAKDMNYFYCAAVQFWKILNQE